MLTARAPRARAPTAATAFTPVLMARRREGSYGTWKAEARNAQCIPRCTVTSAQSVYDETEWIADQAA